MKPKYVLIVAISLILLVSSSFLLFKYFSKNSKEGSNNIKVKLFDEDYLLYPFWAAKDKGYLKDSRFEFEPIVSVVNENNSEQQEYNKFAFDYIVENKPEIAAVSLDNLFRLENLNKGEYKAFAFLSESEDSYMSNIVVPLASSIKKAQDLSGKKIATGTSDIDFLLLSEYLKDNGIFPSQIIKMNYQEMEKNFESSSVDAFYMQEPRVSQLLVSRKVSILVDNPVGKISGDLKYSQTRAFIIKTDFLNNNKSISEDIIKLFSDMASLSKEDMKSSLKNYLDSSWEKAINQRTFAKIELYKEVDLQKISKVAGFLYDGKFIDNIPSIDGLIYKE